MAETRRAAIKRRIETGQQLQQIAAKKLNDPRFHKNVATTRDALSYAKAGVQMEADSLGINRRAAAPAHATNASVAQTFLFVPLLALTGMSMPPMQWLRGR